VGSHYDTVLLTRSDDQAELWLRLSTCAYGTLDRHRAAVPDVHDVIVAVSRPLARVSHRDALGEVSFVVTTCTKAVSCKAHAESVRASGMGFASH